MNSTWQLDSLYTGFDAPELIADLKKAESIHEKYRPLLDALEAASIDPQKGIETYLSYLIEDSKLLRTLSAYGHLNFSVNSKSQEALTLVDKTQTASNHLTEFQVRFKKWFSTGDISSKLSEMAEASALIDAHHFYLEDMKAQSRYLLSANEEVLIAHLKTTGSDAFETLQRKASSQLMVDIHLHGETKKLPIMAVRNLAYEADPALRKLGYEAELNAYRQHEEISAAALNGIKGEVLTLSKLRGFDSPLDETLFNARLSKKTLDAMIGTMEDYLPMFHRYLKLKAKALGHEKGMPFYDIAAPLEGSSKSYTIEEAKSFVVKNFGKLSSDLATFAQRAFDNRWVDFEPREGKVGGAFCSNIQSIGESRVLLNFNGNFKNVLTIAHELGHAFHGDRLRCESILNTGYPMPLAETASIFCETIVRKAAMEEADDDFKCLILENRLQGAMQVVVDILSRYYFESKVFEVREDHPLSVNEFKSLMEEAQLKAYGDCVDPELLHPYMWLNKPHYYYAARNFYNFPYAFGLLFATGLYAIYLERGDAFLNDYDTLLKATGKMSVESVCAVVGVDPTTKDFWEASLKLIEKDVDLLESILSQKSDIM